MDDFFSETRIGALKDEYLGVYGTLRRRSLFRRGPSIAAKLRFFCSGRIRGKLFCQGSYPAAVADNGIIPVEVFLVLDPGVWDDLDRYEGCDFARVSSSLFYRQKVRLLRPSLVVWVYFLGQRQLRGMPIDALALPTSKVSLPPSAHTRQHKAK
jgi:gamma-glutamylcyclotransferase (GGCT)/AIG2-like uncharacterized protein YtfP